MTVTFLVLSAAFFFAVFLSEFEGGEIKRERC